MFILITTLLATFDIAPPDGMDVKVEFGKGLVRCVPPFRSLQNTWAEPVLAIRSRSSTKLRHGRRRKLLRLFGGRVSPSCRRTFLKTIVKHRFPRDER